MCEFVKQPSSKTRSSRPILLGREPCVKKLRSQAVRPGTEIKRKFEECSRRPKNLRKVHREEISSTSNKGGSVGEEVEAGLKDRSKRREE